MVEIRATKMPSAEAQIGEMGQKYLVVGDQMSIRKWEREQPQDAKPPRSREYETVGYVIEGKAQLHIDGETITLNPGDAWVVPAQREHTYTILEPFTAVEATSPPAIAFGRDQPAPQ